MRSSSHCPTGFSVIELLVTVALLGIMSAVATLAVRNIPHPAIDDPGQILADSQKLALETGRVVLLRLVVDGKPAFAAIQPDGGIIADSILEVEQFTGLPARARP